MDRNVLLLKEMIRYYARDPKRIQHFIKVHDFAGMIGKLEGLEDDEQNILEIAAIVHDIGIKVSEEKYGDCSGKHQELEGPVIARTMLEPLGFEDSVRNRIRNHEMAAYKDSLAHRLFREAREIRKQLDNPNSK